MEIKVIGEISREEQEKCIEEIKAKNPDKEITSIEIKADGEYLDCHYHYREANSKGSAASPATLSERSTASTTPRRPR